MVAYQFHKLRVGSSNLPFAPMKVEQDNICIFDSYKIKTIKDMKAILKNLDIDRSLFSLINEWRSHNLIYALGLFRNRTKDVNLNYKLPWYMEIIYTLVSPFYGHYF